MTKPFSLLKPVKTEKPPREAVQIIKDISQKEIYNLIKEMDELIAADIETKGNKVHDYNSEVVGIGLADSKTILYFDVKDNPDIYKTILKALYECNKQLIGFNINFDASYFHRDWSQIINQPISGPSLKWHKWLYDCYALYKQLAGEGWPGQEWNLKSAQIDLLNWEDKGNIELNEWLINNGYFTSVSLTAKKGYQWHEPSQRFCRPDLGKMYLAPAEILGYYCGLDAASTYMLLVEVFVPTIQRLPSKAQSSFYFYHTELFITSVKWNIEQQLRGLKINKDNLIKYTEQLSKEIIKTKEAFYNHPDVAPFVSVWNDTIIDRHLGKQPLMKTKSGADSKNYMNWLVKHEKIKNEQHFNMDSGPQRAWLFYDCLGHEVLLKTEKGNPATDKKALLAWGEPGKLLKKSNDKTKELGYVQSCINNLSESPDGRLHPQYRIPGTLTCRIAGAGAFNVQQQPKSKDYLKEWVPSEDYLTWIDADVESLEAVVLAELSKDKTMRYLYDPSSPKNDIYLYVGAFLPGIRDKILAAGYNPDNPTLDGIAAAKKEAKKERQIAKQCVLGFQYGMGPKKLRASLALEGIKISEQESYEIYKAYWSLFQGIRDFNKHLETEWRQRGGWVYNGIGRPVAVYEMFLRDINNRVVQSTGHDILMYVNYQLYQLRNETKIEFWPIIIDWHDSSLVECLKSDKDEVLKLFNEAYKRCNEWLKGDLLIRTKPQIVNNLAESKCE